jgi:hypothetical protein
MNKIVISNIQDYDFQYENNNFILTSKIPILREKELFEHELEFSKIVDCVVNNIHVNTKKYGPLLVSIYSAINNTQTIIDHSNFTIKLGRVDKKQKGCSSFVYYERLGISFRRECARVCLKEIINMCNICNFKLELCIRLDNGLLVRYCNWGDKLEMVI